MGKLILRPVRSLPARISRWYSRELPYSRLAAVFSSVIAIMLAAIAGLVMSGQDDTAAVAAFGLAAGFATPFVAALAWTLRAWSRRRR